MREQNTFQIMAASTLKQRHDMSWRNNEHLKNANDKQTSGVNNITSNKHVISSLSIALSTAPSRNIFCMCSCLAGEAGAYLFAAQHDSRGSFQATDGMGNKREINSIVMAKLDDNV